jgi:hypothetical protein
MAEPRVLTPLDRNRPTRAAIGALLAGAGALLFAAGLMTGRSLADEPTSVDSCALPLGIEFGALGSAERERIAERAMLCKDLEGGRISPAQYSAGLAALARKPVPAAPPPEVVWAKDVRAVSSQYGTTDWSASRALGAPDALPPGQDSVNAWATAGADDGVEYIEVGFDGQHRMRALDLVESFNPGAVSRVELLLANGERIAVQQAIAPVRPESLFRRRVEFACTSDAVVGVRVTLDSAAVPGWNEIDAIGGVPCAD